MQQQSALSVPEMDKVAQSDLGDTIESLRTDLRRSEAREARLQHARQAELAENRRDRRPVPSPVSNASLTNLGELMSFPSAGSPNVLIPETQDTY